MALALGEYVSVSSQRDVELAQLARRKASPREDPDDELVELAAICKAAGLSPVTAATGGSRADCP